MDYAKTHQLYKTAYSAARMLFCALIRYNRDTDSFVVRFEREEHHTTVPASELSRFCI